MSEDDPQAGLAGGPPSLAAGLAGPMRWIGYLLWGLAVLFLLGGIAALVLNDEGFDPAVLIAPVFLGGLGGASRYASARLGRGGDLPEMPVVAGWTFMGLGALMIVGGIVLVFDDPGGFALIGFGLVFAGAGYLARRLFATPEGKKKIAVTQHAAAITTYAGQPGTRRQATIIHVDEDASEAEIQAARQAHTEAQWRQREDWVAGRIVADEARTGGLVRLAAVLWSVLVLALAGAAAFWDDFIWLAVAITGLIALALWARVVVLAVRARKYGASHFSLAPTPARLGQPIEGEVESGVAKTTRLEEGFRLTLRCVHRWEETVRSGGSDGQRRTRMRRDVMWQEERREQGHATARSPNFTLPVRFEPPAELPASTLSGNEGIVWELVVTAALPGLDYVATFEVPVLAPEAPA